MRVFRQAAHSLTATLLVASRLVIGYQLDINSQDSIKDVSKSMAQDLMGFYTGDKPGGIPGLLPQPYYWWEAGAFLGAMIDYWYYTGDTTYNKVTSDGLLFQVGPNNDYMPPNQTLTEGNDDQGFWGMAVMSAAEYNFPNPPAGQPGWLALAQAVFNTQAARWEPQYCNGGLRWQIFTWNNGFDYKNSISQACFFNIAARLALYTGNATYADWATRTWDWMTGVKFIDEHYYVYDGAHTTDNCTGIVPYQFSYNAGAFLLGAAAMYAYTNNQKQTDNSEIWRERVDGLLNGTDVFFVNMTPTAPKVLFEVACEPVNLCNVDQQSFKAYFSRWMAATTKWAPWTYNKIKPLIQNSAVAAAQQCTGGDNGRMCGTRWVNNSGKWDGTTGVGQQMSALEVVLANMIEQAQAPVTNSTGGTSEGNAGAGGSDIGRTDPHGAAYATAPITTGDRVGAALCTVAVLSALVAACVFMTTDETKTIRENLEDARAVFAGGAGGAAAKLSRKNKDAIHDEKGKGVADYSPGGSMEKTSNSAHGVLETAAPPTTAAGSSLQRPSRTVAGGGNTSRYGSAPLRRKMRERKEPALVQKGAVVRRTFYIRNGRGT
ncbi:glycosyl hydrolase family 76 [Apiospora saccharicola]|uniref:mannan endo-1,6-alpha-mannosidase n=1 Tax=Apiospora saccharicola TaxID=335842 RepID=A0ABR1V9X4_9PEZI